MTSDNKPRSSRKRGALRARPEAADLDRLLTALNVTLLNLAECLVGPGWRLVIDELDMPGLHYILVGEGRMTFENGESVVVRPHTFIIIPPKQRVDVEVPMDGVVHGATHTRILRKEFEDPDAVPGRFVAGDADSKLILICGYFKAVHGHAIEPFARLASPVVEQFASSDRLDHKLKEAMAELVRQEFGMGAMTGALMKQVFVTLFRRALVSTSEWVERFSAMNDGPLSRAFADMVARPGAAHSVQSLSRMAGLSRSAFMDRFSTLFGRSPMAVLRDLRMRQAALLLVEYQVDQVANMVGYKNRSSFCRAFQRFYGDHPSDFRLREQPRGGGDR